MGGTGRSGSAVNGVAHAPSVHVAAAGPLPAKGEFPSPPGDTLPGASPRASGSGGPDVVAPADVTMGVSLINIKTLFDLGEIFRYRWDIATVVCLAEGPMRFRALTRRLGVRIGDRVEDNALDRSLRRLRRAELVIAEQTAVGRRVVPLYMLTDRGQALFNMYQALVLTYQEVADPNSNGRVGQHGRESRVTINGTATV